MLIGVCLLFAVVTAASVEQTYDDAIPLDQRNVDFNEYYVYTLSTLQTSGLPQKLDNDNIELLRGRKTLVLIHEHEGNYRSPMNVEIARAILEREREDVNVLIVDWSIHAAYSYNVADASVPSVAHHLADYLLQLSLVDVHPDNMHIAGFNLGAHIAGHTGRILRSRDAPVARITGLDPSKSSNKLSRQDANYVEVIHTDGGGVILGNGLGEQLGDADFFPNGGRSQPGCWSHSCCHNRSWQLFAASLGWNTFFGNCCNSMTQMRLNNCRSNTQQGMGDNRLVKMSGSCGTGIYRLKTKAAFPY